MKATEVLTQEHRGIEKVLDVMDKAADALLAGKQVPPDMLRDALDFAGGFADKCHHAKEEGNLFPTLQERGMPREGGPISQMLHEHETGRGFIRGAKAALEDYQNGQPDAAGQLAENLKRYVTLLRQHIRKEDNVLFPMADRLLSREDQDTLYERFEEVEEKVIGPGKHEEYHAMIDRLEEEAARL